jgi:hypothetical protein
MLCCTMLCHVRIRVVRNHPTYIPVTLPLSHGLCMYHVYFHYHIYTLLCLSLSSMSVTIVHVCNYLHVQFYLCCLTLHIKYQHPADSMCLTIHTMHVWPCVWLFVFISLLVYSSPLHKSIRTCLYVRLCFCLLLAVYIHTLVCSLLTIHFLPYTLCSTVRETGVCRLVCMPDPCWSTHFLLL